MTDERISSILPEDDPKGAAAPHSVAWAGRLLIPSADATPLIIATNPGATIVLTANQQARMRQIDASAADQLE